jgi:hypothetical protein
VRLHNAQEIMPGKKGMKGESLGKTRKVDTELTENQKQEKQNEQVNYNHAE